MSNVSFTKALTCSPAGPSRMLKCPSPWVQTDATHANTGTSETLNNAVPKLAWCGLKCLLCMPFARWLDSDTCFVLSVIKCHLRLKVSRALSLTFRPRRFYIQKQTQHGLGNVASPTGFNRGAAVKTMANCQTYLMIRDTLHRFFHPI